MNLSVTTIRNFAALLGTDIDLQKLRVDDIPYQAFEEVLGIDSDLAMLLSTYFQYRHYHNDTTRLEDLEGMTPELLARLRCYFLIAQQDE